MAGMTATSWVLLMLVVGAGLAIAGYLAYWDGLRCPEPDSDEAQRLAAGIDVGHGGVPRVLAALYVAMAIGMIGYVLYVWLVAPNI